MRSGAAAPLPCRPDGYPAGRSPVRVLMAEPLPKRCGLAGAQPRKDAHTGRLGSSDRQAEVDWHPQHASVPSVGNANSP
jgi:hypothetical protein